MLIRLANSINRLAKIGAYISLLCFIALVVLIMTEIIGRSFFDYSTLLADEYSGYLYLAAVFFGLGFTLEREGHIRINLLTSRLGTKVQKYIDIFAGTMASITIGFALYYATKFMSDSQEMGMLSENVSETPLYLTQIPMVLGLGLFLLSFVAFLFKRFVDDK